MEGPVDTDSALMPEKGDGIGVDVEAGEISE